MSSPRDNTTEFEEEFLEALVPDDEDDESSDEDNDGETEEDDA